MWYDERDEDKKFHNMPQFLTDLRHFIFTEPNACSYNMGSGGKVAPTPWKNVDKKGTGDLIAIDMADLDVPDHSVDKIMCIHSLEHLPIRQALKALFRWYLKLKEGGQLFIAVPDLDIILDRLKNARDLNEVRWYRFCLFGYQADQSVPYGNVGFNVDYSELETHYNGYNIKMLTTELKHIGYKIDKTYQYDGYNTPSLCCISHK